MAKRLLLVDDENFFLENLKEGLSEHSDVFTTDICFSVNEAVELYERNEYHLIISDIRMPGRSGLEFFEYLREKHYRGGFIAMTAYGSEELFAKIRRFGGLDIILKPFDLKWFIGKVLDFFSEKGTGVYGTIDSIDLTSLLQMINLEKKTVTVGIESDNEKGFLYFNKGEIIHAECGVLVGDKAAFHLIRMNKGRFFLEKAGKETPKTIDTPFLVLMMNIMKAIDEKGVGDHAGGYREKNKKSIQNKEENMDISKLNQAVEYLKSQLGDALLATDVWGTEDGQALAAHNSQPKAVALFNQLTQYMANTLSESEEEFVELGRYYLIDLIGDNMVIVIYLGDFQWGILFNKKKGKLGLLLNVIIPKIIDIFEEAMTG
jgi:CheY-like chemotaxis protein